MHPVFPIRKVEQRVEHHDAIARHVKRSARKCGYRVLDVDALRKAADSAAT